MSANGEVVASADGTKIWAQAAGDPTKPGVVFIHGFACTSMPFEKQFADPELLRNLYLVRYDVRGHGRSDQPLEAEAYESRKHAEDFKAVLDAFRLSKPFVAGWSIGGIIATDIIATYGVDYIAGSILLGGMPYRSMHPQIVHPAVLALSPGLLGDNVGEFSKACKEFPATCVAETFAMPEEMRLLSAGAIAIQHPLVRVHSLARTQDETVLLEAKATFPFLVIHGEEDRHIYVDKVEVFMKENFGNVEFHRLPGVGHMVFYEDAKATNQLILNYIQRLTRIN